MITLNSGSNNINLLLEDKKIYNNNNFTFVFTHVLTNNKIATVPTLTVSSSRYYGFTLILDENNPIPISGSVNMQAGYWDYSILQNSTSTPTTASTGDIILEGRLLVSGPSKILENIESPEIDGLSPVQDFCTRVENCPEIQGISSSLNSVSSSYDQFTKTYNTGSFTGSFTGSAYMDYIDFSPSGNRLSWNDADGTLDLQLKNKNVTLQIGQEQVIRVVNKTNSNLLESEYKVVRVRLQSEGGAQGQRLAIVLAQANNDQNSVDTLGVVTENINNNQEGFITTFGEVKGINTTGNLQGENWLDGDVLYLSPTIPGALTKIKPEAPQHMVVVGYVVYAHQNNGKIFVKIQNGYELGELHNVKLNTPQNGDVLTYSSSLWISSQSFRTGSFSGSFTGSLLGTASFATSASRAVSASFASTASNLSVALTGTGPLAASGSQVVILPRSGLFSAKPSNPFTGQIYFATDIGTNGTLFTWNGSIWRADNPITYLDNTTLNTTNTTETIVKSQLIPASILQPNSVIELEVLYQISFSSGTITLRGFLETTNTGTTNIVYTTPITSNLQQLSVSKQVVNRNSLTSQLLRFTATGTFGMQGSTSVGLPTFSINTANDTFLNFAINRGGVVGNTVNLVMTKILIYQ